MLTLCFVALLAPSVIQAGTTGDEILCNQTVAGHQANFGRNAVALDGNGNFIVVWNSEQSTEGDIYARRFFANGTPNGAEFLVNSRTDGPQGYPAVAMNASGQFVIAWESPDVEDTGIRARSYGADGVPLALDFQVNTNAALRQQFPAVAIDSSGNYVCVWQSEVFDGLVFDYDIHFQRFNNAGNLVGTETWVNATNYLDNQEFPAVAYGPAGNFVIAWEGPVASINQGREILCRGFNNAGTQLFPEKVVNAYQLGDQIQVSLAMDNSGNFTVVWCSFKDNSGANYGIYGQRMIANAIGDVVGNEFQVHTTTAGDQFVPFIAMDVTGKFTVVWQGPDAANSGIFGQVFNAAAVAQGSEFALNSTTAAAQQIPSCAVDSTGRGVCAWTSYGQDAASTYGVIARRFFQINQVPTLLSGPTAAPNPVTLVP